MKTKEECIDEIIDGFDFKKVRKVMKFLKWEWEPSGEIPNKKELRNTARDLLSRAWDNTLSEKMDYVVATGGFEVSTWYSAKKVSFINLSFIISHNFLEL